MTNSCINASAVGWEKSVKAAAQRTKMIETESREKSLARLQHQLQAITVREERALKRVATLEVELAACRQQATEEVAQLEEALRAMTQLAETAGITEENEGPSVPNPVTALRSGAATAGRAPRTAWRSTMRWRSQSCWPTARR